MKRFSRAPGAAASVADRSVWVVISGLLLGQFLSAMDTLLVVTALPTIIGDLGGADRVSWVITAYMLASTALSPLIGKLGDLYGRRRLYQMGIVAFVAGSMLAGAVTSMNQLIAARAVQGLGAAALMTLPMAIIGDVAAPRDRPKYQGVMGVSMLTASIGGPVVGGFFVDHATWRYAFWINLPLGLLALLASRRLPPPRRSGATPQLDLAGAALVVPTAASALLIVEWGGRTYDWGSPQIMFLAVAVVVFGLLLVTVERRAVEPVLPGRIFRQRAVMIIIAGGVASAVAMWIPWVLMPTFLQVVTGASATNSGLNLAPMILALTATSALVGRYITTTGKYVSLPPLGSAIAVVGLFLYTTMGADTTRFEASTYMVIVGVGLGMSMQVLVIAAQANAAQRDIGVATAAVGFTRQLGGALGATIAVSVYNSAFADNLARVFSPAEREALGDGVLRGSPEAIRALEPAQSALVVDALADALHKAFLFAVPAMLAAGVILLFVGHRDLRVTDEETIDGPPAKGAEDVLTAAGNPPQPDHTVQ